MREHLFHLPTESGASLQSQLREMVVRVILDGHLPAGTPLPSCRRLAKQLGVARNTVMLAYQQLVDEGYLLARERSGYYVNGDILEGRVRRTAPPPHEQSQTRGIFAPAWEYRLVEYPSRQRNIDKPRDWQRYRYPFIYGQVDLALFPVNEWRECARQALSVGAIRRWASDSIDTDDPELIEQIHTRVLPRRGVWAAPEEILVTVGAQQALFLLAELLVHPDTVVGLEEPGYPDARNIFARKTSRLEALDVDSAGLVPSGNLDTCDYVFTTPSHQSPTTVTMSLQRRREVLRRAADADFVVIEDDYESEFNYGGEPTPALKSLDRGERVIYVGSLSKTLAPGLRIGFMIGPRELIREARALRRLMLRHPASNNQRAVALFLSHGHHDSLVRRMSHTFRERWQAMHDALNEHLPGAATMPTFGGTSFWVQGPENLDASELGNLAAERGVLIERGDVNFFRDPPPRNAFRLGFSSIPTEYIEPGVAEIGQLVRQLTA
ncbi:MAG: PLP-dependent aminotransferase family protein [Gammaproteobacteria bacterium]